MKLKFWSIGRLALLILLSFTCCKEPQTLEELMTMYEEKGHRNKIKSPFSGAVLVAKDGKVVYKQALGFADRNTKVPNTTETIFPIASVTKQFTSFLVMKMVEEGRLELDDTISEHLGYFPKDPGDQITIHQLLSHTSGLQHYEGLLETGMDRQTFLTTEYSPKELVTLVGKTRLSNPPGTTYSYSSLGYMILGAIVEKVSGMSYKELINEKIVKPLGLKNTGFESNTFVEDHVATGYEYEEVYGLDWWFQKYGGTINEASFRDQSNKYATGGMHSTIEDLFTWSEAIRNSTLLEAELTRKMLNPNLAGYCYGWIRNWSDLVERNTKARMYMHSGALPGYRSSISLYDDGTTIIFLTNISPINDKEILHKIYLLANELEDEFRLDGYPKWNSLDKFKSNGGLPALKNYFDRLTNLCGYEVLPSERSLVSIMALYVEGEELQTADSLKQLFFDSYKPDLSTINSVGYRMLSLDRCDYALEFFRKNTQEFPNNANVWDSQGDGYKNCGDLKNAIDSYRKAVKLAEANDDMNIPIYRENLSSALKLKQ